MHPEHATRLRADHGRLMLLLRDATVPGHVGDHLDDALTDLALLAGLPPPPGPTPELNGQGRPDPVTVVGAVRAHLHAAILDTAGTTEMLALGDIARHLALAERDLTGRPCPELLAARDARAAVSALQR